MSRIKEALSKTDNCWFSMLNDNVELLGVVIDNKLNFKSHISKLIKGVLRKVDVFNRFNHILSCLGMIHLSFHILLTVAPFGIAVSKKIGTD